MRYIINMAKKLDKEMQEIQQMIGKLKIKEPTEYDIKLVKFSVLYYFGELIGNMPKPTDESEKIFFDYITNFFNVISDDIALWSKERTKTVAENVFKLMKVAEIAVAAIKNEENLDKEEIEKIVH